MCSDFIRLKSYDFFRMFEVNPRKKQPFPQNKAHLQDEIKKTVRTFNNQGHFARFLCFEIFYRQVDCKFYRDPAYNGVKPFFTPLQAGHCF